MMSNSKPINTSQALNIKNGSLIQSGIKNPPYLFFLLFLLLQFLLTFVEGNLLVTEELLIKHYDAILTIDRIEIMLETRKEFWWVNYLLILIYYGIKFLLISLVYLTGEQLFNYKISYKSILNITIISEFIFFAPRLIIFIWFYVLDIDYSLEDLRNFNWYSLKGYIESDVILKYFSYPIHTINLFEFLYLVLSSYFFCTLINNQISKGFIFVICTYGVSLFFWTTLMVMLNLYLK